jgi:ammonium transporter, Amt family
MMLWMFGVCTVLGIFGTILLGVFASSAVNSAGTDGLLLGGSGFFFKQVIAVVAASAYAFIFTYVMLILINFITPVRVSEEAEKKGIDETEHGERAYDEGVL